MPPVLTPAITVPSAGTAAALPSAAVVSKATEVKEKAKAPLEAKVVVPIVPAPPPPAPKQGRGAPKPPAESSMGVKTGGGGGGGVGHKRCSYPGCNRPEQGKRFYRIQPESTAGGQDWKSLAGSVLCHMCYTQFTKKGTLVRTVHRGQPLEANQKRCSYAGCKKPDSSWKFIKIAGGSKAGKKDWSALANKVICGTCYDQFKRTGTLERAFHRGDPLENTARKCTYTGCKKPTESKTFYQIHGSSTAGGKDWKCLDGSVLCESCYDQYRKRGTLERTIHRAEDRPERPPDVAPPVVVAASVTVTPVASKPAAAVPVVTAAAIPAAPAPAPPAK